MQIRVLKSKIHQAAVTQTELEYHGSITIDRDLMDAVGLIPHEQVLVANCNNGLRGETYVISGPRGSGVIQMNGALARMAQVGDRVIVLAFAAMTPAEASRHQPQIAILNAKNQITERFLGPLDDA